MVDTINIRLSKESAGNIDFPALIPPLLQNVKYGEDEAGNRWHTGRLGNFKVIVSDNAVTVKDGSLTKWYLGDNLKILSRSDIKKAIEKMSDCLHLPIKEADVRAFHFGKNIPVKYPVSLYLPYLGTNGRYTRLEQKSTINYKIVERELCIYDKIAEMKHKGDMPPPLYDGKNILRYEKRYNKNLTGYFSIATIKAATLYDEDFYMRIITDWHKDYLNIQKQKQFKLNTEMITTKEQMKMLGVLSLIEMQGRKLAAINDVVERYRKRILTKKQAHDLKELINQAANLKLQTKESDLIIELDKKMKEAVSYFR